MKRAGAPPVRRDVAAGLAAAALGSLLAGALGAAAAPWLSAHTSGREPLPPTNFQLVVPGVKATGLKLSEAARSGLADGHLVLQTRLFGARERLAPRATDLAAVEVRLARGSDPVELNAAGSGGELTPVAILTVDGARRVNGDVVPYAEPRLAVVEFHDGSAWMGGHRMAAAVGGTVELAPVGSAVLASVRGVDRTGRVVVADDFDVPLAPAGRLRWAAALALAGAALGWGLSSPRATALGRVAVLAALALPAAVLAVAYPAWAAAAEHAYLVDVDVGALRKLALGLAAVPAALGVLGLRAALDPDRLPRWRASTPAVVAAVALPSLAGLRGLEGAEWALPVLGVLAAWLPHRLGRAAALPSGAVLARDAPALLAPAVLGWGLGLLPAVAWRLWCVGADAPRLLRRGAAAAGADTLLVLALLVPVATEGALRAGPTDRWWDADALAGASVGGADDARVTVPFWSSACGAGTSAVYAFGGSSTGGAWQLRASPESFFPARLHARLCEAGRPVRTLNYGEGGRDSFDFAQAAPRLFDERPPALVILYFGVNDLLTREAPVTRRQRAEILSGRGAAVGWLDRVTSGSRLLTGVGLLLRPRDEVRRVAAVPLDDAEVNLRAIVAEAARHGATTLLVPELTRESEAGSLAGYVALMTRLADELDAAELVDARAALGPALEGWMVDRNHLDPAGCDALAAVLAPAALAALPEPAP